MNRREIERIYFGGVQERAREREKEKGDKTKHLREWQRGGSAVVAERCADDSNVCGDDVNRDFIE